MVCQSADNDVVVGSCLKLARHPPPLSAKRHDRQRDQARLVLGNPGFADSQNIIATARAVNRPLQNLAFDICYGHQGFT